MPIEQNTSPQNQTEPTVRKRRTKYQTINGNFRKEIIKYWEDNRGVKTLKEMASNLRIPRSTLASITKIYENTGRVESFKRGGCQYVKMDDEQLQLIQDLVDENPSITLKAIQSRLQLQFNMKTPHSITGIDYALKKRLKYTLKKLHK
ncbi:hypothetical protein INT47_012741 [Mucor saturninus]|uniref:Uncharacterized protein n=1 Tax=Mucor saturninus TaxID=64648 RepID=A0A8H7R3Z4_9FUNG|nr:hypothetical protein INT47_012741 [Mucor saturninus]